MVLQTLLTSARDSFIHLGGTQRTHYIHETAIINIYNVYIIHKTITAQWQTAGKYMQVLQQLQFVAKPCVNM